MVGESWDVFAKRLFVVQTFAVSCVIIQGEAPCLPSSPMPMGAGPPSRNLQEAGFYFAMKNKKEKRKNFEKIVIILKFVVQAI